VNLACVSSKRVFGTVGCVLLLVSALTPEAAEMTRNQIKAIHTESGGKNIKIELHSDEAFPARSELAVLQIGDKEFTRSQYPRDGSTKTIIFTLTTEEFAQLHNGERVLFKYGLGEQPDKRDFGRLDKSRLDKN
jgi:hypothetical protein